MALSTPATLDVTNGHDERHALVDKLSFVGDDAYPTGGSVGFTAFARAAVGKGNITVVAVLPVNCGGYLPQFDAANDKLIMYAPGGSEVADTTDLSSTTFEVLVVSV